MTEPVRLAKQLATLVQCSRREAELYIAGGWVRVDGEVVEEPQFKLTTQRVELDPDAELAPALPATLVWHKPAGVDLGADGRACAPLITVATRAQDDYSGVRPLKRHFAHLSSAVALEADAGGMVVFTQDRGLARKFADDGDRFEHEYVVEIAGEPGGDVLTLIQRAHGIDKQAPTSIKASWQSEARLRIAIKSVLPGQIRLLCEAAGLRVTAIKRLRVGRISMAKLNPGEWRYLAAHERF